MDASASLKSAIRYIEDTPSGFVQTESTPGVDDLIADLFGHGGKVIFCEDCTVTEHGGRYHFQTVDEAGKRVSE